MRARVGALAMAVVLVAGGCGDDDGRDDATTAALDELAGSVEMSRGVVDAMQDLIWQENTDGGMQRWEASGWQGMATITITGAAEPFDEGWPWVHVVEDSPEAVWVLLSAQPTSLNPALVDEGILPPDPPEDLRFVSAVLGLERHTSPSGEFRIDCETGEAEPAVALVLAGDDDRPVARAWSVRGPLQHVPTSDVTCP